MIVSNYCHIPVGSLTGSKPYSYLLISTSNHPC